MIVTTVTYSELVSGENYSNRTIGATAAVEPGEDADAVLDSLRTWVQERHAGIEHNETAIRVQQYQLDSLTRETCDQEDRLSAMKERYEQAKEFLKRCGIPVPQRWGDEVPF